MAETELINDTKEAKDKIILNLNDKVDKALKKSKSMTGLKKIVTKIIKL